MENILEKIVAHKKLELGSTKQEMPLAMLKNYFKDIRNFKAALKELKVNIVAEIKKASPSKGELCADMDVLKYAKMYEKNGAAAISILTETEFFKGKIEYLQSISQSVKIPVLRKDFIIDPYQIFESRFFGADAILLIAAVLDDKTLVEFLDICKELKMQALVEVHNEEEMQRVLAVDAEIIGINNRNLKTFEVDIKTTEKLMRLVQDSKERVFVSESGIFKREDIDLLKGLGVDAFLVGEAIVTSDAPEKKLRELLL